MANNQGPMTEATYYTLLAFLNEIGKKLVEDGRVLEENL